MSKPRTSKLYLPSFSTLTPYGISSPRASPPHVEPALARFFLTIGWPLDEAIGNFVGCMEEMQIDWKRELEHVPLLVPVDGDGDFDQVAVGEHGVVLCEPRIAPGAFDLECGFDRAMLDQAHACGGKCADHLVELVHTVTPGVAFVAQHQRAGRGAQHLEAMLLVEQAAHKAAFRIEFQPPAGVFHAGVVGLHRLECSGVWHNMIHAVAQRW